MKVVDNKPRSVKEQGLVSELSENNFVLGNVMILEQGGLHVKQV